MFISIFCIFALFNQTSCIVNRSFPEFNFINLQHETIDNGAFKDRTTLVVLFHLGCYPAMVLLKDLEYFKKANPDINIMCMTENTPTQLDQFYGDTNSYCYGLAQQFSLDTTSLNIIAVCDGNDKILTSQGDTVIQRQCQTMSNMLRTKSSPTLVLVEDNGKILKFERGYWIHPDWKVRLKHLQEFCE
jgi:hypothetical protein